MIKGVVFDFNGTLFWDTHIHNQAWDKFLEKHHILLSDGEKNERIHGKNNAEILNNLFNKKLVENELQELSIQKESIYQQLCLDQQMELAPGAVEFIEFLKRNDLQYTIATAAPLFNIDFYFKELGLAQYFDRSLVVYSDFKTKSKPHPELFLKAFENLKLKPEEALIFEDSFSGIKAAENAKAGKVIIVNSNNDDYSQWDHQQIIDFNEVDRAILSIIPTS